MFATSDRSPRPWARSLGLERSARLTRVCRSAPLSLKHPHHNPPPHDVQLRPAGCGRANALSEAAISINGAYVRGCRDACPFSPKMQAERAGSGEPPHGVPPGCEVGVRARVLPRTALVCAERQTDVLCPVPVPGRLIRLARGGSSLHY